MKKLSLFFLVCGFAACSSDHVDLINNDESIYVDNSHKISEQDAVNRLLFMFNQTGAVSRGMESTSDISDIHAITWDEINPGEPNPTICASGMGNKYTKVDTCFYAVNFANNAGYAIVAADDRTEPIYAIMDHGRYNPGDWTLDKAGQQTVLVDRALDLFLADLSVEVVYKWPDEEVEKSLFAGVFIAPKLNTRWGRTNPYNMFWNDELDASIVALAQMMTYFRSISEVRTEPVGSITIDWDNIISECNDTTSGMRGVPRSAEAIKQVAALTKYLSENLNFNTTDTLLYSMSDSNSGLLRDIANLDVSPVYDYDVDDIVKVLHNGSIVIFSGTYVQEDLNVSGSLKKTRIWVVDGTDVLGYNNGDKYKYSQFLHCNWGMDGEANGYYLGKLFSSKDAKPDKGLIPQGEFHLESTKYIVVSQYGGE